MGLKDHNSGKTDSGNPERVFWGRKRVRGLLTQKTEVAESCLVRIIIDVSKTIFVCKGSQVALGVC